MFRLAIAVFVVLLIPSLSFATTDPDPSGVGVYFDAVGATNAVDVEPGVPFDAYIVITNPVTPEVGGVVLGYRIEVVEGAESSLVRLANLWNAQEDFEGGNHLVLEGYYHLGLSTTAPTNGALVVVRWQFYLLEPAVLEFYICEAIEPHYPDGALEYEWGPSGPHQLYPSSGDPSKPVARVNADGPVRTNSMSFGAVKSLFR